MFTTFKVRANQSAGDYRDPGDFPQPPGTQAHEWTGAPYKASPATAPRQTAPGRAPGAPQVVKPGTAAAKPAGGTHRH